MKKQETVFEALKDIYHHLKEWSDPSSALKKGNLLPLAIVIFCFSILIVYIPQEPFIFSGTILENLQLGNRPNINYSDISEACRIAQIKNDIESMPLQLKLDENGAGLSGGQKQRLTIARALLSPAQMLIFDESTSNLDALTEANLVNELLKLRKTVIFIAHRLSIARKTNNIVVLKKGRIAEQGSHYKLLTKKGEYYRLLNATGELNE